MAVSGRGQRSHRILIPLYHYSRGKWGTRIHKGKHGPGVFIDVTFTLTLVLERRCMTLSEYLKRQAQKRLLGLTERFVHYLRELGNRNKRDEVGGDIGQREVERGFITVTGER